MTLSFAEYKLLVFKFMYQRVPFPVGLLTCSLRYDSKPHCALWGVATTLYLNYSKVLSRLEK